MTLRFVQDIRNKINTDLPDNTTGLITPATIRGVLQDMTDSLFSRSAGVYGDHQSAPASQALTTTPTNYPTIYNANLNLNPSIFSVDQSTGIITLLQAGFVHTFDISANFSGPNNNDLIMQVFRNSVAEPRTLVTENTTGTSNYITMDVQIPFVGIAVNDTLELRLSSTSAGTFNFAALLLSATLSPTVSAV